MPREKALASYSHKPLGAVFARVARTRAPVTLPLSTTQALSVRAEVYAFRRVALKNPTEARLLGIDLAAFNEVQLKIVPEGLMFYHKSESPLAKVLEEALGTVLEEGPSSEVPASTHEVEDSLARILRLADKGEGG